jgi:4-hydroxy-3-polyprenylbenzoate decarboxylase
MPAEITDLLQHHGHQVTLLREVLPIRSLDPVVIAKAQELGAILLSLNGDFADILDLALPAEGVFHNQVFVSIRKTYPMQAYRIMHGLWGLWQMMFTNYLVVVDADVDVHNTSGVLFHLCANTDPQRDSLFTKGPADVLDHATSEIASGSKLGMDATKKLPGEGFKRSWPPLIKMGAAVRRKVASLFGNAGDRHCEVV